jgi:BirA family biotin operon repressor/biotin-[acetyl-CoA-carboxylase] ligase
MEYISRPGKILGLLLKSRSGVSEGEICGFADCSQAETEKALDELRAQGFVIEASNNDGYILVSEPRWVLPARIEARLSQGSLGIPYIYFTEIDSTNLEARKRAEQGLPHGACISAEIQTAGRGRLNRRWEAPSGTSLMFSILFRPSLDLSEVFSITNLMAVSVCTAVEEMGGPSLAIKWPNDIYLEGRKVAGILTEFTSCSEHIQYVVVGVGLNVNINKAQLERIDARATSLLAATGLPWDRAVLFAEIMNHASSLYKGLIQGDRSSLARSYNDRFWLAGKQVEVKDSHEIVKGIAVGVAADGALLLELPQGGTKIIRNGDVTVLSISP